MILCEHTDLDGISKMRELPGTETEIEADLIFLAMGFLHPEHGLVNDLGLKLDNRGNIAIDRNHMTNVDGVFAAGDSTRGASLVVWAISEGRGRGSGYRYLFEAYLKLIKIHWLAVFTLTPDVMRKKIWITADGRGGRGEGEKNSTKRRSC